MRLISGARHQAALHRFVLGNIDHCSGSFGLYTAFGVVDEAGKPVAGWIWHNYDRDAGVIEFSAASVRKNWLTRSILNALFAYAFDTAHCQLVTTRNKASNRPLHRQLAAIGFDRIEVPRLFGRDDDGVLWTMSHEQWLESKFYMKGEGHGQIQFAATCA
ncbi:MAG: N-acetyltransferase [Pseudomonadota bacterium]